MNFMFEQIPGNQHMGHSWIYHNVDTKSPMSLRMKHKVHLEIIFFFGCVYQ